MVEPGAGLAICVALASSFVGRPVPETTVACGEVGLGGELRQVGRLDFRLAEASRMGFTTTVVPRSAPHGADRAAEGTHAGRRTRSVGPAADLTLHL